MELRLCGPQSLGCDDCGKEALVELHTREAPPERGYWSFCAADLTLELLRLRLAASARVQPTAELLLFPEAA